MWNFKFLKLLNLAYNLNLNLHEIKNLPTL
jgi:hypothetical protein